jgi:hypothetical protein
MSKVVASERAFPSEDINDQPNRYDRPRAILRLCSLFVFAFFFFSLWFSPFVPLSLSFSFSLMVTLLGLFDRVKTRIPPYKLVSVRSQGKPVVGGANRKEKISFSRIHSPTKPIYYIIVPEVV